MCFKMDGRASFKTFYKMREKEVSGMMRRLNDLLKTFVPAFAKSTSGITNDCCVSHRSGTLGYKRGWGGVGRALHGT